MFERRKISLLMVLLLIISFIPSAFASNNNHIITDLNSEDKERIINYVCDLVVDSYADYYTVPNISGEIDTVIAEKDGLHVTVDVFLEKYF